MTSVTVRVWALSLGLVGLLLPHCTAAGVVIPTDYPTIQMGIDTSSDGDTVFVLPGTYTGSGNKDLSYHGKELVLLSTDGAAVTIIDCEGDGHGVLFGEGEGPAAEIRGFTIRHASGLRGAVLIAAGSAAVVRDCILTNNTSVHPGSGVFCRGTCHIVGCEIAYNSGSGLSLEQARAVVDSCFIHDNIASAGGGLYLDWQYGRTISIRNTIIAGNQGVELGGGFYITGEFELKNCLITGNLAPRGGGLYMTGCQFNTVEGCTISGNRVSEYGGGICLRAARIFPRRSIVWGNCSDLGENGGAEVMLFPTQTGNVIVFTCCAIDSTGITRPPLFPYQVHYIGDQVFEDPKFCEPFSCDLAPTIGGDYHLMATSPCLEECSPCDSLIGAYGLGCELSGVLARFGLTGSDLRVAPNPIGNGPCNIQFSTLEDGPVRVEVIDVRGRMVWEKRFSRRAAGDLSVSWSGRGLDGELVPSGVYWVRVLGASCVAQSRIVVVR